MEKVRNEQITNEMKMDWNIREPIEIKQLGNARWLEEYRSGFLWRGESEYIHEEGGVTILMK